MKRFRVLTAALCAAVLLCGFSVPAYAYAGGEGEDYGDPTMETPAPEPTITPGELPLPEKSFLRNSFSHTNSRRNTVTACGSRDGNVSRRSWRKSMRGSI